MSAFPAADACRSDWLFTPLPAAGNGTANPPALGGGMCRPGSIGYANLSADTAAQNFAAVLIGDCTGNWQPAGSPGFRQRAAAPRVRLDPLRHRRGGGLRAAVTIASGAAAFQAVTFTLDVDPPLARLVHVRPVRGARGSALQFNRVEPGSYIVALAGAAPIGGRVTLLLDFTAPRREAVAASLRVRDVRIDE